MSRTTGARSGSISQPERSSSRHRSPKCRRGTPQRAPAGHADALAAHGALADLLVFHLGGVAAHVADQLAFRGIVERFADEGDFDAVMLGLREDDAQMDRIAG